jgi:hypothetical protein
MIYAPVASVGYFTMGDCVNANVIMSISKGPVRTAAEVDNLTNPCIILFQNYNLLFKAR